MHPLAERLLKTIQKQKLMQAGDRVAVAVSGGADSVALLCLLLELRLELGVVLSIAHVNHKLRGGESDEDQRFVFEMAARHGLEFHACAATVLAAQVEPSGKKSGIEAAARELRYGFFRELWEQNRVTTIATAHTLDDQAETVLLRIFRGTGIRGLSGIHPRLIFEEHDGIFGVVIRPLLSFRRAAIKEFLREEGESWREDLSNEDVSFLRNRIRHRLLPMIVQEFGESAIEHMSELAEIARGDEELLRGADYKQHSGPSLPTRSFSELPLAGQRRLLRGWLEANETDVSFRIVEQARELAAAPPGKRVELPGGFFLRRGREEFLLEFEDSRGGCGGADYEYALKIPGSIEVPEIGVCFEGRLAEVLSVPDAEREQLLNVDRIPKEIVVRNWRSGDRYWPAHSASEKKVKELLSDRHVTRLEKKMWPVALAKGCGLIWLRGYAAPQAFRAPAGAVQAIWIRELRA